jgi:hypothetical protein
MMRAAWRRVITASRPARDRRPVGRESDLVVLDKLGVHEQREFERLLMVRTFSFARISLQTRCQWLLPFLPIPFHVVDGVAPGDGQVA